MCIWNTVAAAATATVTSRSRRQCCLLCIAYDFVIGEKTLAQTNGCAEHVQINLAEIHGQTSRYTPYATAL